MTNTVNTTLPIQQRPGLVPVLRYGNFAGEGYAGRLGLETTIQHPDINAGNPIDVKELVQTPQGLASFMKVTVQTEPNGYMDAVTRNHDVEYTVAEIRYMNNVQAQFDGKLPHELTWEDKQTPAFKQLESARNDEYWQADQRMLNAVAEYHPEDFADANYRGLLLNAFYVKAESGLVGYGKTEEATNFYQELKLKDERIEPLSTAQAVLTFNRANTLAQANFEELATLPITPQERQFFNQHLLQPGASLDTFTKNQEGMSIPDGQMDYTHRLVVPKQTSENIFESTVKIGDQTVTMRLDVTNKNEPVFTKVTTVKGEVVSEQVITAVATDVADQGQFNIRAYNVVTHDAQGNLLEHSTIEKPPVPDLPTPVDLQAKIDAVKSGNYREVVAEVQTNPHSVDAVNGMDLQSDQAKESQSPSNADKNESPNADSQITDALSNADQSAADIKAKYPDTVQVADAGGDTHTSTTTSPETNSDLTQSQAQGGVAMFNAAMAAQHWGQLDDAQRAAVLGQMYMAGGQMSGGATSLDAGADGVVSGLNFINAIEHGQSLQALQSGLQLGQAGLSAYSTSMADAANAMMDDMMASNSVSAAESAAYDAAAQSATESAAASNALGEAVPYVAVALAMKNFADNPEQAALTYAGMYAGEAIGAAFGGPVGAVIGGAIGGMIGGALGGMFGDDDPPPPPEGAVHFSWDESGQIQHTIDYNQSGGGDAANSVAASVQTMLQSLVNAHNAQTASTADDIAINPYLLPKMGFSGSSAWMEVVLPDGSTVREGINQENFAHRLLAVLQDNGAIAPAWQVQTQLGHYQQALQEGQTQEQAEAPLRLGAGGQAVAGDEAFSLQGNAAESGDFKTQTFGAMVVHLNDNPDVQAAQTQLSTVLRDVEGDGYFEQTQSVAAKDSAGNLQAVLTIDFNGDGVIQTRDILNLGGNTSAGNPTDEARLANAHADQQRNNVQWLDANGDGVLDKSDPAFAAIKLWVDVNQDGVQAGNEASGLSAMHISSINFKTGQVTYEDGHTDALSATTLKADTEGVKLTQINEVNPDGTLHVLDAGLVVEHEGYQGKVQITDEGGTRWASEREQTYEQQAKRTGDWEGTAEQDAHRHGGGNVDGTPTETTATGATSLGEVKTQANVTTQSTVVEGDARVVSDAPTQDAPSQVNAQTTVAAGDSRIKSNAPNTNNNTSNTNAANTPRPAGDARVVFVPISQATLQNEIQTVTDSMIESSQSMLFGAAANASLGVLAAVGLGAVQGAQAAEQRPTLVSEPLGQGALSSFVPSFVSTGNTFNTTLSKTAVSTASAEAAQVVFRQVDLGMFSVAPQMVQAKALNSVDTSVSLQTSPMLVTAPQLQATVVLNPAEQVAAPATTSSATPDAQPSATTQTNALTLGYPVVQAETLQATEDVVLRLTQSVLLANDSTPNASADPKQPALTITAVSAPLHGQVSLVNGEVLFAPDVDFHGTASFTYMVTDQYGLSTNSSATLEIAAVNDAPVTQGESYASDEDIGLIFTQAQLLANDTDVDVATDGQVLSISRVGQAEHGTVWLDAQGNLRFVPDANYHGPAQFTYWVSDGAAADGAGAETPATMSLTIAEVNDIPVVQGESTNTTEDTTLSIDAATLLANDTDVDTATDGQVLSISAVSNAAHCTVSLVTQADGTQQITFVPDANFHGTATFDYTVNDGNGGTAVATAVVNLSAVNDAPVTMGETATSDEDTPLLFTSADLLTNDTDVDVATDGQVLSISRVGNATHGTVSLDAQGQVHFTPDANYHGPAQFTYWVSDGSATNGAGAEVPATVSLTILAVNDLPVVTGEAVNTNEDTTLLFAPATLLANDTDVDVATDGQVLSITAVSNATHGTVVFVTQPDGSQRIAFTPEANYFGVASYQYTVSDGNGGNTVGTVVVNLAQVNDTPVAADDSLSSTAEDTALHISFSSLLGNDTDADSHNSQWGGTDDVLTVTAVGNATHGTVAIVNGEVVFTPDANYHGPASFAYQVTDSSGAVSQALATLTVTAVNDLPVAVGETISSNEDTTLVISQAALLQNDNDVDVATDGQVLSVSAVANAKHGTVTLNADGTISFVPDANYYGNASFDYTVHDGNGGTATATATISLANVNDAPVATGETVNSNEDEVLTITASALLQNDRDIDNARADLSISRVQSGTGGTVSLNASGNVVFTPTANYNGTATFTYWVKDPGGLESNAVTTTVLLAAVNDAPSAQGEIVTGASEDAVFNINKATLLANDHDIDDPDSALSLSWVGNAQHGSVALDGSGNVVFTPDANYHGSAQFSYRVKDAAGAESPTVQAAFDVASVNDAPLAVDDQFSTYKNSTMTIGFSQLTGNDSDVDGDTLTVSAVRDHANGHASIVNGQVQFVANTGFTGSASFDYLADDGHGGQTWATAFVDVKQPPNQYARANWSGTFSWPDNGSYGYADDGSYQFYANRFIGSFTANDDGYVASITNITGNGSIDFSSMTFTLYSINTQSTSTWSVVDNLGLENVWHLDFQGLSQGSNGKWYFSLSSYMDHYGYYYPPLVMDLNGDGVHFTSIQNSNVSIDVNHDGINDKMAWAGNDDGVLVWDKDHNHQITDASEFGFQTLKAGAQTDLEGLQALDTNGDGLLDAADDKFAEFAVWQDANGNGVTDAGEFKTLTELGIASINLHSDGQVRDAGTLLANSGSGETDATVMGNAAFTRTDGSTGVAADTMLAYEAGHATQTVEASANAEPQVIDTTAADAQRAEIMRQALLFNQVCNTAVAIDSTPLGFVPIAPDVQLHDMLVAPQDGSHQLSHAA